MGPVNQKGKERIERHNDYFNIVIADLEKGILSAEVDVHSRYVYTKWTQNLKKIRQLEPECILLPKQYKTTTKAFCGDTFKLELQYDCFHILLSEQVQKRRQVDKYLQEAQMWYLLYCLTEAAHQCNKLQSPIGDVRPENLLLNIHGKLAIISSVSLPTTRDIFIDSASKRKLLLAPQYLEALKKSYKSIRIDHILPQSFSIGMTVLSVGILQDITKCYNYENFEINMLQFNKATNFWHQNQFYSQKFQEKISYSKQLKNIVARMLDMNPDIRLSSLEVYDILKFHKGSIMKLEPFQLTQEQLSPKRKHRPTNSIIHQSIHTLKSRKASKKSSPKKQEMNQPSNIMPSEAEFTFQSPSSIIPNVNESITNSPTRKKKITTSLSLHHRPPSTQQK